MASLLPDPDPKTMRRMESMHFLVEGAFIQDQARRRFWYEDNEDGAVSMLQCIKGLTDTDMQKILHGDMEIKGWGICDKKECKQCVGLKAIYLDARPNKKFKKEIEKRVAWLTEACYKIGQFHIEKETIDQYTTALIRLEYVTKKHYDDDLVDAEIEEIARLEKSMYSTNGYKLPSPTYIPKESSRDYKFNEAVQNWFASVKYQIKQAVENKTPLQELEEVLVARISEKPIKLEIVQDANGRIEGHTLLIVPDPENDYQPVKINCPKEHLLNYYQQKFHEERGIKFTMALEGTKEKEKLIKRVQNLEKAVGHVHALLMHSMGLRHTETGWYDVDWLEFFVNGAIQAFIMDHKFDWDAKDKEAKLPDEIRLELPVKARNVANVYYDGKLIREMRDIR